MRLALVLLFIVVACGVSMYEFNPSQFNSVLAGVGITSWRAPEAPSTHPSTADVAPATKIN